MGNSLAIYVSSFDGCSDLWDTFFSIFNIYWQDCKYPVYLINNELPYTKSNVKTMNTGKEIHWFHRTIKSLEELNEDYVFFFLEDYFISKLVKNEDIDEIIDFMENNHIYYYRISSVPFLKSDQIRLNNSANMKYPICLQPAIWKRKELIKILKEINGKSPWDFEYYYSSQCAEHPRNFEGVMYDTRDLLGYKNGVLRGKWIPQTLAYYKKKGIIIDTGKRAKLPWAKALKYSMADWLSHHTSENYKASMKKISKLIRFDYLH